MTILGSHEPSPRLLDSFHYESTDSDIVLSGPDSQLKEDLADAMQDCAPISMERESGKLIFDLSVIFFCIILRFGID